MTETKSSDRAGTVDQAEAERTDAEVQIERLSKERLELLGQGAEVGRPALARLDAELTAAGEQLGRADLAVQRASSRSPFDVDKFCAQQSRVSDLQQTVQNRNTEFNEAHSHRNALKNAIETFDASEDSRTLARSLQAAGRGQKMGAEDLRIARQIADLRERLIAAEVTRTRCAEALAEVKARSHVESAILESWRAAVLALPGGARMLQNLPRPHRPSDTSGMDPARNVIGQSVDHMPPKAGASAGAPGSAPGSAPAPAAAAPAAAAPAAAPASPAATTAAGMWARAGAKTNAQRGLGPPQDAFTPPVPIQRLIETINTDPDALGLLAARSDLTEDQRTAALRAYRPSRDSSGTQPPWARKAAKKKPAKVASKPKAKPAATEQSTPRRRGLFGLRLAQQRRI